MIDITEEQKIFLSNYVENLENLLKKDVLGDLLTAIDDAIVDNILANEDEPEEPDKTGIKLQKIYDQIYNQN